MNISYGNSKDAWNGYQEYLYNLISDENIKTVCEIGGGANPSISLNSIKEYKIDEYTIVDISSRELEKAPQFYHKVQADICDTEINLEKKYDLVISKMLAEHVKDGEIFNRNIFNLLNENGIAFHFFPTLYALPFSINKMMPEKISSLILSIVQSGRENEGKRGKFPAYYSWCRGPVKSQIRKYEKLGYKVQEYIGFYGHDGYYEKVPFVKNIHAFICKILQNFPVPIPILTSFAYVVLTKNREKIIKNSF